MAKIKRGQVTLELDIEDFLCYLRNDLEIDARYVEEKFKDVLNIDISGLDWGIPINVIDNKIILVIPELED